MLNYEAALTNVSLLWLLTAPHEFAHAWVATLLGDDTPRREGRVTLNPLAHVDWLGTTILPAITSLFGGGFLGWGKPVNTNPARLRWGLKGLAVVALAGPASNVVFAVILAVVAVLFRNASPQVANYFAQGVRLSLYLAIFNLVPVPPLDGSKLLLAMKIPYSIYAELARFGFPLLLVLLTATSFGYWMSEASYEGRGANFSISAITSVFGRPLRDPVDDKRSCDSLLSGDQSQSELFLKGVEKAGAGGIGGLAGRGIGLRRRGRRVRRRRMRHRRDCLRAPRLEPDQRRAISYLPPQVR